MAKACSRLLFFISFIPINLALSIPQPTFLFNYCSDIGNHESSSTYETNLNSVMSLFSSNTQVTYGFYNFSVGQEPDQVNAIALCRGDMALDVCRNCVNVSTFTIVQNCPYYMEAIIFYDECMLRYSNKSIFGVVENQPSHNMTSHLYVSDVNQFNGVLEDLLHRLRSRAASGNSLRKFASDDAPANFQEIYALVQCTPDLSQQQCEDCLVSAIGDFPLYCIGKQGCRILRPSCNFRFETYTFYTPDAPSPDAPSKSNSTATPPAQSKSNSTATPPVPPPKKGKNLKFTITITIIIICTVLILVIFICMCFIPEWRNQAVVMVILGALFSVDGSLLAVLLS